VLSSLPRGLRVLVELNAARPEYAAGLRAATATIVPLALGDLSHQPALTWMAVGGWLSAFADAGGAYAPRASAMTSFGLLGALGLFLGSIASPAPGIALLFVLAFCCCIVRSLGDSAATVGTLVLIAFCLGLGNHTAAQPALLRGGLLIAGCALSMALTLGLWPIHPYGPARSAISDCYEALASYAQALSQTAHQTLGESEWHDLNRTQRGRARLLIEKARATLTEVRGNRQAETARGGRLLELFQAVDLLLGDLIALSDGLQAQAERGGELTLLLPLGKLERALHAAARAAELPKGTLAETELLGLRGMLRAAPMPGRVLADLGHALLAQPQRSPAALRDILRTAVAPGSLDLHHALRMSCTVTATALIAHALSLQRVHWALVTVVIILQPHPGSSFRKGLQRVFGTVVGSAAAALLAHLVHGPLWTALLLFPLSVLAIALKPVSYALFAAFVTPVFVIMAESAAGDWHLVSVRIIDTLLGGGLSLLGAALLWPSWEHQRLAPILATLLERNRDYLRELMQPSATDSAVLLARRQVGLANNNAEAALQRLLDEPRPAARVQSIMSICAASRRLSGALAALWAQGASGAGLEPLDAALDELCLAAREERAPAPLPPLPATESQDERARALVQLAVLHGAFTQLASLNEPTSGERHQSGRSLQPETHFRGDL